MTEAIRRWLSFRRNRDFWRWVEDNYTREELERLTKEATDFDDSWNPFGSFWGLDQHFRFVDARRGLTKWLYSHYGKDIWWLCAEEAHKRAFGTSIWECQKAHGLPDEHPHIVHVDKWNLLAGLSQMEMACYANSPDDFEEFMVRNALKDAASQVLLKPERTDSKASHQSTRKRNLLVASAVVIAVAVVVAFAFLYNIDDKAKEKARRVVPPTVDDGSISEIGYIYDVRKEIDFTRREREITWWVKIPTTNKIYSCGWDSGYPDFHKNDGVVLIHNKVRAETRDS